MDFREDGSAVEQSCQYLFGKIIPRCPRYEPGATEWNVYLPQSFDWYDFWTGKRFTGGQAIKTDAPPDKIPLFVKAGSIVPMGPVVQYTGEDPGDRLEIRIYAGANGEFTLYEDEGDNYNYEKGAYSTITFTWDDAKKTLSVGDRKGSFNGMPAARKFNIVRVEKDRGAGITDEAENFDKKVTYIGKRMVIKF